jgi:hypothetical protein
MGFDVFGHAPRSERGKYFGNTIWWWCPLANYCQHVAPDVCEPCRHWYSNDHDGLDDAAAIALADALNVEILAGRTLCYEKRYMDALEAAPDVLCDWCDGTGIRQPVPKRGAGDPNNGGFRCNACDAEGHVRPLDYPFSTENVADFVAFLKDCGGFSIG